MWCTMQCNAVAVLSVCSGFVFQHKDSVTTMSAAQADISLLPTTRSNTATPTFLAYWKFPWQHHGTYVPSTLSRQLFLRFRTVRLYLAREPNLGILESWLNPSRRWVTLSTHCGVERGEVRSTQIASGYYWEHTMKMKVVTSWTSIPSVLPSILLLLIFMISRHGR